MSKAPLTEIDAGSRELLQWLGVGAVAAALAPGAPGGPGGL